MKYLFLLLLMPLTLSAKRTDISFSVGNTFNSLPKSASDFDWLEVDIDGNEIKGHTAYKTNLFNPTLSFQFTTRYTNVYWRLSLKAFTSNIKTVNTTEFGDKNIYHTYTTPSAIQLLPEFGLYEALSPRSSIDCGVMAGMSMNFNPRKASYYPYSQTSDFKIAPTIGLSISYCYNISKSVGFEIATKPSYTFISGVVDTRNNKPFKTVNSNYYSIPVLIGFVLSI